MLFIFLLSLCVFIFFSFLTCIMHRAFNLFVFPNYMFTSFFFFFFLSIFYERAMSSPEKKHLKITIIIIIMSLTCCIKSHCTPASLAPAHTPCLFSIDLHTVKQHLVIVHFLLLLLLSGTLFQMMSGVPHHSHHLSLV